VPQSRTEDLHQVPGPQDTHRETRRLIARFDSTSFSVEIKNLSQTHTLSILRIRGVICPVRRVREDRGIYVVSNRQQRGTDSLLSAPSFPLRIVAYSLLFAEHVMYIYYAEIQSSRTTHSRICRMKGLEAKVRG